MRLLAIDQGSSECGVAYFIDDDVKPRGTDLFRPKSSLPWLERMKAIVDALAQRAVVASWAPDVVAIESVALHNTGRVNSRVKTALIMSETRGYLKCALYGLFGNVRFFDVHPSTVKAAARARTGRANAKEDIRHAVETLTGLTGLSEDECDSIAIGWAAFGKLREERLAKMVDEADQQVMR